MYDDYRDKVGRSGDKDDYNESHKNTRKISEYEKASGNEERRTLTRWRSFAYYEPGMEDNYNDDIDAIEPPEFGDW